MNRPELPSPTEWAVVHEPGGFRVETLAETWAREATAVIGSHIAKMLSTPDVAWFTLHAPRGNA